MEKPTAAIVLSEPAGSRMDAWVAQFVMSWLPYPNTAEGWVGWWDGDWVVWTERPTIDPLDPHESKAWTPSVNFCMALRVFEWLSGRGIVRLSNGDGDSCDVDFLSYTQSLHWGSHLRDAHVTEETYALAICRAALLSIVEG